MDQGVRYVVSINGQQQVVSALQSMESSALKTDASIASLGQSLKGLAGALGIGFGLHALIDFGKDAVQGAADYETAVKRIKFASESLKDGMTNIAFISSEVDKFKIPLQDATDSYGKFLAMLNGSGIAGDQIRKLHDQLLTIGKVKGLGDGQMDAAIMNLGKMLEAGGLDARHFRPLEQQLSGIGAFVAKELGISVHELALLRNKGHMAEIDPKVLLTAIEKMSGSLEHFLPEATTTIQSQLNDLDNSWLRFKNDLVYDNLPELKALFETLKGGVAWLKEHEEGIVTFGKTVLTLGKVWLEYKAVMFAVNGLNAIWLAASGVETTAVARQTSATVGLNAAIMELNANLARLVELQGAVAVSASTMTEAQVMANAANLPIKVPMGGAGGLGAKVMGGMTPVIIGAFAAEALLQMMPNDPLTGKGWGLGRFFGNVSPGGAGPDGLAFGLSTLAMLGYDPLGDMLRGGTGTVQGDQGANMNALMGRRDYSGSNPFFPASGGAHAKTTKIAPPNDHITGQRVITYNISIKEINGIKENTVQNGGQMQTEAVAAALRDVIINVVNDSQIRADH